MGNPAKKSPFEKPRLPKSLIRQVSKEDGLTITRGRKSGVSAFEQFEIPHRHTPTWKHAMASEFMPTESSYQQVEHVLLTTLNQGDDSLVQFFVERDLRITLSKEANDAGVTVQNLRNTTTYPVGEVVDANHGFYEALNLALWSAGLVIDVPDNVTLKDPITLEIHSSSKVPFLRLFYNIGNGSNVKFALKFVCNQPAERTICVTESRVHENAHVEQAVVFQLNKDTTLLYTHRNAVYENAKSKITAVQTGEGRLKADIGNTLLGRHAQGDIKSFTLLLGNSKSNIHTAHNHLHKVTFSDIKSRNVVMDSARISNTGIIRIVSSGKNSEAFQVAKNLVLSDDAKAVAVPELEIETNDVVCSHGAATGTIDKNQLFYLMSRGLSKGDATKLIVHGWLNDTISNNSAAIQSFIQNQVKPVLENGFSKIWNIQ